ncbi:hypothetical protein VOLCADRAFT_106099 [Volvox carteri f. nagariensis]|uniref:EF-hand domain-containing protein n=1 Tax=Volvox carteri f. nagariensis TaxID=3068 RepID=D8U527_VOLCA|nr:uncharacterized protein VOLCADRAFT_106099 [Volvox carteri f. nagariensis]EFJ45074.1 hypothetical protein VOLCADRAFT_106099 [Volvox carteri f. nagariensis]|eukprot:XP_002953750.1 hypothetical protein VOLCADRAFT_106099 [Volvox carteri f. nagariensis]
MDALSLSKFRNPHVISSWRRARKSLLVVQASPLHQNVDLSNRRQEPESLKASVSLSNINPKRSETELVLDQAQQDLTELCKAEDGLECWKALSYFVSKRQQFELHCNLSNDEGEHDPEACTSLNGLEKFVREQMSTGSVRNMRTNLLIMQRVEERRAADGTARTTSAVPAMTDKEVHARACLIRLFHVLDTDGDGEIGMLEFQDGMEALGAVLTDVDMCQISEAVGNSKNRLDIDEQTYRQIFIYLHFCRFIEVMETSAVLHGVALGDDSNFLRHAAHLHSTHHMNGANHSRTTTKIA